MIHICKRIRRINKAVGLLMILSFLIFNYKTDFLVMSPCSRLFFLIYVIVVCSNNNYMARIDSKENFARYENTI